MIPPMTLAEAMADESKHLCVGECPSGTALSSLRDGARLRGLHPSGFNRLSRENCNG